MKQEYKLTLTVVVLTIITLFLIEKFILSKTIVTPTITERTKIFNQGNINEIKQYLEQPGATVVMDNYYALMERNRSDIMEMMFKDFKLNPDFNFKYEYATPLLGAAKEFKPEIVAVLIKYGATVNYKDPYGVTPLIAASYTVFEEQNSISLKISKILVEAGADINIVSEFGKTAIEGALFSNDIKRVKYLVDKGGDIQHLNPSGSNYMFYCDYIECFEYFLRQGFDINSTNYKGKSIFQDAHYLERSLDLTKQLLEWGGDICHKDNLGDTVLNYVERQRIAQHLKKEQPEIYQRLINENRAGEIYKFLEIKYRKKCL